jgi:hypothetical protein
MNRPQETDPDTHEPTKIEREDGQGNFYSGSETFFGVFTQAQVYLHGVRLVHNEKVTQQVSDLASQIENNRRKFLHSGDVNFALQELLRIASSFNQRVQAWESEATRRERNKKAMSGAALAKMKSEFSMVRTKVRLASRTLTKLEIELHQIAGKELSESNDAALTTDVQTKRMPVATVNDLMEPQKPAISPEEQARAAECAQELDQVLKQLIGDSMLVSFENAKQRVSGDPDRMEQLWDTPATAKIPLLLVVGWHTKHPDQADAGQDRKRLDLTVWLIPKSMNASRALGHADGQVSLAIRSRKLDSANITFETASETEFPRSEVITGFLEKFANRYGDDSPTLLVGHFRNLEWSQRKVLVTCDPQGASRGD